VTDIKVTEMLIPADWVAFAEQMEGLTKNRGKSPAIKMQRIYSDRRILFRGINFLVPDAT
jgi:hypothetical protein